MPALYRINDQGGRGSEISGGCCWGFMGRSDDYDPFHSTPAKYAENTSTDAIATPSHLMFADADALGYLTWLTEESPYRDVFTNSPEEIIQTGDCKITMDVCNQSLILGLSHLRRLNHHGYMIWNQLDPSIPSGMRAILVQMLHPYSDSRARQLGSGDGDNTSTSFRYFDAASLCSWIEGEQLNHESFAELGQYELGFSGLYADTFASGGRTLREVDLPSPRSYKTIKGLFFTGQAHVLTDEPTALADKILAAITEPSFCNDEQRAVILGDYKLTDKE